jgi:uncharacterized damage-inducible protein DinB
MNSEIKSYWEWMEKLRTQVSQIVADLPAAALNWQPVASEDHATNSLAVLSAHIAGAEQHWIYEMVGQGPATRDRPAEFVTVATEAADLVRRLAQTGEETRQIMTALTADSLNETRTIDDHTFTERWCIMHVIEHTALHLGHMQLTAQLWHETHTNSH